MNAVRVVVLTTNGPAAVERITEEDPDVSSVICLSGKAVALPVSGAYDAFVREPTGVVQHHFGHRAYRVDVDAMIDEGYSWQLGVLAAHALDAAGRLAGKGEAADRVIWLTGEVDRDLDVLAVGHLTDKLQRAVEARVGTADAKAPLSIYVPAPNRGDIDEAWLAGRGLAPNACRLLAAETVNEVLRDLELDPLAARPAAAAPAAVVTHGQPVSKSRRPLLWGAGAVVAAAAVLVLFVRAFGGLTDLAAAGRLAELDAALESSPDSGLAQRFRVKLFEAYLDRSRPAVGSLGLELVERRPPGGSTCAAVHIGRVDPVIKPLPIEEGRFQASPSDGLCGLRLGVRATGSDVRLLALSQHWSGGRRVGGGRADATGRTAVVRGVLSLDVDPPRRARRPLAYHHTVFAAVGPLDGVEAWWERHVLQPGVAPGSGAWFAAAERLGRRGVTVVGRRHRVTR